MVDRREAALAYRNLLGGGANMAMPNVHNNQTIPPWLRFRLGQCLTGIAGKDLPSVVDVFVASVRGPGGGGGANNDGSSSNGNADEDIMTGAAARLARALCAKPAGSSSSTKGDWNAFQFRLCYQFVQFLVAEGRGLSNELFALNDGRNGNHNQLQRSRKSVAMSLSFWATIGQLTDETLHSCLTAKLMSGLVPSVSSSLEKNGMNLATPKQSIEAIAAWLLTTPSSLDPSTQKKVNAILLVPQEEGVSLLSQALRLATSLDDASTKSSLIIEVDPTNANDKRAFGKLTQMVMAQMLHTIVQCDSSGSENHHYATLAIQLLTAISTNTFDKDGHYFNFDEDDKPTICTRTNATGVDFLSTMIGDMECRAKCLVDAMTSLLELEEKDQSSGSGGNGVGVGILASSLFRLVLSLHFANFSTTDEGSIHNHSALELDALLSNTDKEELKIAASILLALLCENCQPSILIGGGGNANGSNDDGVLKMLGVVIDATAAHLQKESVAQEEGPEELLSTTSIVLSLLVALLELGEERRSESDEAFFLSLLPSLRAISISTNGIENGSSESSSQQSTVMVELAEMSTHAMALIASRGAITETSNAAAETSESSEEKSRMKLIIVKLAKAESDLQSNQPPLRAKGVVSLRHIAHSLVSEERDGSSSDSIRIDPEGEGETNGLVTEIRNDGEESRSTWLSVKEELALISRTLAWICLKALADEESYVYLAAIQTLVAISDVCPSEIMPLMGLAIAKGQVNLDIATVESLTAPIELSLTREQRIKATEALIFMIRKRGDAIFVYGPTLLELMLFGQKKGRGESSSYKENISEAIQSQTHTYFVGEQTENGDEGNNDDEQTIRINTGGPVFSIEEGDVVRAGAISVVCELVAALPPMAVASYCHALVLLATNALLLEASRPVRRAAASLARELYACMTREVTSEDGSSSKHSSEFSLAMVKAGEERLHNSLTSCVSGGDPDVRDKTRLLDPATQSRCSEAIHLRSELQSMGVLHAAAAISSSMERELNDPGVQAVRRALSNHTLLSQSIKELR